MRLSSWMGPSTSRPQPPATERISGATIMPPGRSMLPVISQRARIAWPAGMASRVMSTATPHCSVEFLALPSMRAAAMILSSGTQVISETRSTGNSAARSASSSKP